MISLTLTSKKLKYPPPKGVDTLFRGFKTLNLFGGILQRIFKKDHGSDKWFARVIDKGIHLKL
jgi:hypothetical protein